MCNCGMCHLFLPFFDCVLIFLDSDVSGIFKSPLPALPVSRYPLRSLSILAMRNTMFCLTAMVHEVCTKVDDAE